MVFSSSYQLCTLWMLNWEFHSSFYRNAWSPKVRRVVAGRVWGWRRDGKAEGLVCSLVSWGEEEAKGKRLESGRRECWCCGRVSVRGAVARKMGATAWFWPGEKLSLWFFFYGYPKFLSLKKITLRKFFSSPCAYVWMFTYIENLYTFYLRKYCNNYCRDCLL